MLHVVTRGAEELVVVEGVVEAFLRSQQIGGKVLCGAVGRLTSCARGGLLQLACHVD